MEILKIKDIEKELIFTGKSIRALVFEETPKNCGDCVLHVLTLKGIHTKEEIFSCAGYKKRGTLNPECDFLNTFDNYSRNTASNCPLKSITL